MALHLYRPASSNMAFLTSMRDRTADKSNSYCVISTLSIEVKIISSRYQTIFGVGIPLAEQRNCTVCVDGIVASVGTSINCGRAVMVEKHREHWIC